MNIFVDVGLMETVRPYRRNFLTFSRRSPGTGEQVREHVKKTCDFMHLSIYNYFLKLGLNWMISKEKNFGTKGQIHREISIFYKDIGKNVQVFNGYPLKQN